MRELSALGSAPDFEPCYWIEQSLTQFSLVSQPEDISRELLQTHRRCLFVWQHADHTLLNPAATAAQYEQFCNVAFETSQFLGAPPATLCIPSSWVKAVRNTVHELGLLTSISATVGFPHGSGTSKHEEALTAILDGAKEIDAVINIGRLIGGDIAYIEKEIRMLEEICAIKRATLKIILETCELTPAQIELGCRIAADQGAHFVKTSTGFGREGATIDAVRLMRETVQKKCGVKASGGITSWVDGERFLLAGANRIGCSDKLRQSIMRSLNPAI